MVTATAFDAAAYCRSTTCVGDCARDNDECKIEGQVLYWPTQCLGFSLQANGSIHGESCRLVAAESILFFSL